MAKVVGLLSAIRRLTNGIPIAAFEQRGTICRSQAYLSDLKHLYLTQEPKGSAD